MIRSLTTSRNKASAEAALLQLFNEDSTLPTSLFAILNQKAPPLFHVAQVASLECVMKVYSLNPKAILSKTKCGYTPHHFAAVARNDDVLRFLVLQNPKALSQPPSILTMLVERIDALDLLKFCLELYPQGLYETVNDGNTLLHKACQVSTFPYLGPRPKVIQYLVKEYPQACERANHEGNLPLHLLLEHSPLLNHSTIHTKSALLLLDAYPKALQIPNPNGILPLELCLDGGASPDLIRHCNEAQELVLPSHHATVICAHLRQTCPAPHLVQCKVWDSLCGALARAVSIMLAQRQVPYKQLTIAYTRIETTGLTMIIQALERNNTVRHAMLAANVGYYASKVGGEVAELAPDTDICVALGGSHSTDSDLSKALQRLFCFNSTLTAMDLSDNKLPKDPQWLFPLMGNRTLLWLNLSRTNMGSRLLSALIPVIRHNDTLQELQLSCTSLSEQCLIDLMFVLQETKSLRRIAFLASTPRLLEAARVTLEGNAHIYSIHFESTTATGVDSRLQHLSRLNRAGRAEAIKSVNSLTKTLSNVDDLSVIYDLVREAVPVWAGKKQQQTKTCKPMHSSINQTTKKLNK